MRADHIGDVTEAGLLLEAAYKLVTEKDIQILL